MAVMCSTLKDREEGIRIGGFMLSNLRFSDDISNLSESEEDLQEMVTRIASEAEKLGMKINVGKTEVQYVGNGIRKRMNRRVDGDQ